MTHKIKKTRQIRGRLKDVIVRMTETYPNGFYPSGTSGCLARHYSKTNFVSFCHRDIHEGDPYHIAVIDRYNDNLGSLSQKCVVWVELDHE